MRSRARNCLGCPACFSSQISLSVNLRPVRGQAAAGWATLKWRASDSMATCPSAGMQPLACNNFGTMLMSFVSRASSVSASVTKPGTSFRTVRRPFAGPQPGADRHGALPELRRRGEDLAAILEQPTIKKNLRHLGLQADGGRMTAPARGHAPQEGLALASASAACRAGRRRARQPVGRNCKRPETLQPTRFRRPGAQGRRDRLRQSRSGPRCGARFARETRRSGRDTARRIG